MLSSTELECPLPPSTSTSTVCTWNISVTNDGQSYSNPLQLTVYNSRCLDCDCSGNCQLKVSNDVVSWRQLGLAINVSWQMTLLYVVLYCFGSTNYRSPASWTLCFSGDLPFADIMFRYVYLLANKPIDWLALSWASLPAQWITREAIPPACNAPRCVIIRLYPADFSRYAPAIAMHAQYCVLCQALLSESISLVCYILVYSVIAVEFSQKALRELIYVLLLEPEMNSILTFRRKL